MNPYESVKRIEGLFDLLQDDKSRELFWMRLRCDVESDMDSAMAIGQAAGYLADGKLWKKKMIDAFGQGRQLLLYGAGHGGAEYAMLLKRSGIDFWGFADRNKAGQTYCGKPVLSLEELIRKKEQYFIAITTQLYQEEIYQSLKKEGFSDEQLIMDFGCNMKHIPEAPEQYFEFLEFFPRGTAFVDGGSYDGADSIRFSKWCSGNYSKILAFEPDDTNYCRCKDRFNKEPDLRIELIKAGLDRERRELTLFSGGISSSYTESRDETKLNVLRPENVSASTITTVTIDDVVNTKVGMVKLDIEGAEFDALCGAKRTLRHDKPFLAICVYHRQGDLLAIMDYLHTIVPEYRFWLRHYGPLSEESVLYAAVL